MADFCKQCSIELFGEDFKELAGLCSEEDNHNGLYASVICEGCGVTLVDHTGRCVRKGCLRMHGKIDTEVAIVGTTVPACPPLDSAVEDPSNTAALEQELLKAILLKMVSVGKSPSDTKKKHYVPYQYKLRAVLNYVLGTNSWVSFELEAEREYWEAQNLH